MTLHHRFPTLADVRAAVTASDLPPVRKRDLVSAVNRVSAILDVALGDLPASPGELRERLAGVTPAAHRISAKTWATVRSNALTAIAQSGLETVLRTATMKLTSDWVALFDAIEDQRISTGLSRFARYCSDAAILPTCVNSEVVTAFVAAVRETTLALTAQHLEQQVIKAWSRLRKSPAGEHLPMLAIVPMVRVAKRIDWETLPASFRSDVNSYFAWLSRADDFDDNARTRTLKPRTIKLKRDQFHAAVTALVASGMAAARITSLASLIEPEAFKTILRQRRDEAQGRPKQFNIDLGESLIATAREWVKTPDETLQKMRGWVGKLPKPASSFTEKNKTMLRQFDDPHNLRALFDLPGTLFAEAKRMAPSQRSLTRAQTALGIIILLYAPLRLTNLVQLAFTKTLFLPRTDKEESQIEIPGEDVKNGEEIGYALPDSVTVMLRAYHNKIAPAVLGRAPFFLFCNPDGSRKCSSAVEGFLTRTVKRRLGLDLTPHQYRHLLAKVALDASPGNYLLVSQALGHSSSKVTARHYAGLNTRRAARHHAKLIHTKLSEIQPLTTRPGRRSKKDR